MPISHSQNQEVRDRIIQALKLVKIEKWDEARSLIASTRDPVASKVFSWISYKKKSSDDLNFARLSHFIRSNPEWPSRGTLKTKAEKAMPQNIALRDTVAWFDSYKPRTITGTDRYVGALIEQGNIKKARDYLGNWWANTPLSREDQRILFRKYNRYMNTSVHRKRLDMLLYKGQYTNARAIADVLQKGYPQLAEARIALAENKAKVNDKINAVPATLQNDSGLVYERLRWRRRHELDMGAIELLNQMPSVKNIQNKSSWWRERHIIIRRLIEDKKYNSAYVLASTHQQDSGLPYAQAEWLAGWLALRFLNEPLKAFEHFQVLHTKVKSPISRARAAYWAGRAAHEISGQDKLAMLWYQSASRHITTYYGQLAAAELSEEGRLPSIAPPKLTSQNQTDFRNHELIQAAYLFHAAGFRKEASSFLQAFVVHKKSAKAYKFTAEFASDLKLYHDAVRIAKDATKQGLFLTAQAYPLMVEYLGNVKEEWALIHALMRQESSFDLDARSPAGALGLMQLMPATAKETAQKLGVSHRTSWLTTRPEHNIRLGTSYMGHVLDRFDHAYPLAIAAYNAGPGRVNQWVKIYGDPRKGEIDILDWIELIPIYETRNYVQRVVEGTYIYRLRLKGVKQSPIFKARNSMAMPKSIKFM